MNQEAKKYLDALGPFGSHVVAFIALAGLAASFKNSAESLGWKLFAILTFLGCIVWLAALFFATRSSDFEPTIRVPRYPDRRTRVVAVCMTLLSLMPAGYALTRMVSSPDTSDATSDVSDDQSNPYFATIGQSGDLVAVLESAIEELEIITATDYVQIFVIATSEYDQRFVCVADVVAPGRQRYRIASISGLIGESYTNGKLINARAVADRPDYITVVPETKAQLVVPITAADRIFGVINSESEREGHFDDRMEMKVQQVADVIGKSLRELAAGTRQPIHKLPWLRRQPRRLSSETTGPNDVLALSSLIAIPIKDEHGNERKVYETRTGVFDRTLVRAAIVGIVFEQPRTVDEVVQQVAARFSLAEEPITDLTRETLTTEIGLCTHVLGKGSTHAGKLHLGQMPVTEP